jgi:hypothetical protein
LLFSPSPDDGIRPAGRPRKFTDIQLIIVIVVFDRGGGGAGFQIGKDSIRRILCVNLSTVKRHLRRLLGLGWILRKQRRISRRLNSPNVYTLTIFAPQRPYLNTKTKVPTFSTMRRAKTERSSYARDLYEWRGRRLRHEQRQKNHPKRSPEEIERWEHNQKMKKLREANPRHDWTRPNPFLGLWEPNAQVTSMPENPTHRSQDEIEREIERLTAEIASNRIEREAREAAEKERREAEIAERIRRDEDFVRRNYRTV